MTKDFNQKKMNKRKNIIINVENGNAKIIFTAILIMVIPFLLLVAIDENKHEKKDKKSNS